MIPYSRQSIDLKDIASVKKVLTSKFLTQGPIVEKFENQFKKYVGSKYSVSCTNATSGLYLSCLALGLKKGDIVWTTTNSFVASANCALMCGCEIDLIDISLKTFNIDIEKLEKKLKKTKKPPKAIINVHFAGLPSSPEKIFKLSKKYKFKIIEDASHALGSEHKGNKVGTCKWSDLSVFSFHPVKPITTGEGGMITTNNKKYYQNLKILREHGILRSKKFKPWIYKQVKLSLNFRMTEMQAALGVSQLSKIDSFNKKRNLIAKKYIKSLKKLDVKFQEVDELSYSAYHLFVILTKKRDQLFRYLRKNGVFCQFHYIPMYKHPYFKLKLKKSKLKQEIINSENYYKKAISIPIFPTLNQKNFNIILKLLNSFYQSSAKK